MSITTYEEPIMDKIKSTSASDLAEAEPTARGIFTRQTGQTLSTLGTLFKHVPPFNETIDKSTSETLISIGRKLKGQR